MAFDLDDEELEATRKLNGTSEENDIDNIKFFLGDLKASNYNSSFIEGVENLIQEYKELKKLEDVTIETLKDTNYIHNNYIPKSKVKEKIEILEKCTTKIDKKVNLTDYMIIGQTERAIGRFVNLDFIKKVLLDEPGYNIELLEEDDDK